jgi:hypothetical protein
LHKLYPVVSSGDIMSAKLTYLQWGTGKRRRSWMPGRDWMY